METKRCALYVRVSTQEQKNHGLSVDSQISALVDYCKDKNYEVIKIYNDAGISARKKYTRRPALLKLIEDCNDGKIDLILFTRLDRWFRSVADYYEVQTILDKNKVAWRAIWEDYETETSSGVFKVNIMLSVAQSEADKTSERIKSVNEYKKAKGDYVGSAPIGYKVVKTALIVDEDKRDGIKALFDTFLLKNSLKDALEEAEKKGLKLERQHAYKILKNPVYCGMASNGYMSEAFITTEEHEKIIERFNSRMREPKSKTRVYLFSGLCVCGYCGFKMGAKSIMRTHADGTKVEYKKYVCQRTYGTKTPCPHLQIVEPVIENYLISKLDELLASKRVEVEKNNSKLLPNGEQKKKQLEQKLSRLANLYEDGDIDIYTYRLKRDAIKAEISALIISPMDAPAELPKEWLDIYMQLDAQHKKSFWSKIIKSITITNDNKQAPLVDFK